MSMQAPAGPVSGHAKRSKSGPARRATKPTPSTTTAAKLNHAADLFRSKSCVVSVGKSSIAGIHIHDAGVLHFAATPKVHGKVPGHHEAVLQLGDFALAVRRVRGCGLALGKLLRRVRGLEDGDRPGVGLELDDDDEYDSDDDAAERASHAPTAPHAYAWTPTLTRFHTRARPSRGGGHPAGVLPARQRQPRAPPRRRRPPAVALRHRPRCAPGAPAARRAPRPPACPPCHRPVLLERAVCRHGDPAVSHRAPVVQRRGHPPPLLDGAAPDGGLARAPPQEGKRATNRHPLAREAPLTRHPSPRKSSHSTPSSAAARSSSAPPAQRARRRCGKSSRAR